MTDRETPGHKTLSGHLTDDAREWDMEIWRPSVENVTLGRGGVW